VVSTDETIIHVFSPAKTQGFSPKDTPELIYYKPEDSAEALSVRLFDELTKVEELKDGKEAPGPQSF